MLRRGHQAALQVPAAFLTKTLTIFVPSPNVAEDHQTKNAMALVGKQAARMIPDRDAVNGVFPVVDELLADPKQLAEMERNILTLGIGDSADRVVNEVMDVVNEK